MNSKITEVIKGITKEILVLMKTEKGNWTKPWVGVHSISNKTHEYQGFNCLILALARHKNEWQRKVWGTYKQWKDAECQVDKDQHGTKILRPQIIKGKDDKGKEKVFTTFRPFKVFNIQQCSGETHKFDSFDQPPARDIKNNKRIDKHISTLGADIRHGDSMAYYNPKSDFIGMPDQKAFKDDIYYYTTLFHELTHWTGHEKRCNRKLKCWGGKDYAFEELVAELGASFLANHFRIESKPREDHIQYLQTWIKGLENHSTMLFKASSLAEKAVQFIVKNKLNLRKVA